VSKRWGPPNNLELNTELFTEEHEAILYLLRGRSFVRRTQLVEAMREFRSAEELMNKNGSRFKALRAQLAEAYASLGWLTGSVDAFRHSLDLSKSNETYLILLGRRRLRDRNYHQAIAAYQQLISLVPDDYFFHAALGFTYRHTGQYEEAISAFKQAIGLNSEEEFLWIGLGNSYAALSRYDDACSAFEHALSVNSYSATAHSSLTRIYQLLGKEELSQTHKEKALRLFKKIEGLSFPNKLISYYNRACFEAICGNFDLAVELLLKAVKKSPDLLDLAKYDSDFELIRADERFQKAIKEEGP